MTENGRAVITWANMTVGENQPVRIDAGVAVHPRGGDLTGSHPGGGQGKQQLTAPALVG